MIENTGENIVTEKSDSNICGISVSVSPYEDSFDKGNEPLFSRSFIRWTCREKEIKVRFPAERWSHLAGQIKWYEFIKKFIQFCRHWWDSPAPRLNLHATGQVSVTGEAPWSPSASECAFPAAEKFSPHAF